MEQLWNQRDRNTPAKSVVSQNTEMHPFCGSILFHQFSLKNQKHIISNIHSIWHVLYQIVQTFNSCTSRPDICQCLVVQTSMDNMSKNKPSTSTTHVESKLRLVARSFLHQYPRNWVAIRRAVVYHAQAAQYLSAGIKCRHCRYVS